MKKHYEYDYEDEIEFGAIIVTVGVIYQVIPGHAGRGPDLNGPGEPAEDASVEIEKIYWKYDSAAWQLASDEMFDLLMDAMGGHDDVTQNLLECFEAQAEEEAYERAEAARDAWND